MIFSVSMRSKGIVVRYFLEVVSSWALRQVVSGSKEKPDIDRRL